MPFENKTDSALICIQGHLITLGPTTLDSGKLKKLCEECGSEIISKCSNCDESILKTEFIGTNFPEMGFQWTYKYKNTNPSNIKIPKVCGNCGTSFPWTDAPKREFSGKDLAIQKIENIFNKFHEVVKSLKSRHNKRPTLEITDEYDVQDLLRSLLRLEFASVIEEDSSPEVAGKNPRIDFILPDVDIAIEVKIMGKNSTTSKVADELFADVGRYTSHPKSKTLLCFIYDPEGKIENKEYFIQGVNNSSHSERMEVKTYINP